MGRKNVRVEVVIIAFVIFFIAFVLHSIDLNSEGRTWDEQFKTDTGMAALKNISSGKFSYDDWAVGFEHPPLAKYLYGLSFYPELKTINPKNVTQDEYLYLLNENYYAGMRDGLIKIQPYDFTLPRLASASLNAATVTLTFLVAHLFFQQLLPSVISSVILISIPRFFAMGRLMTYESISGFLITLLFLWFFSRCKKEKTEVAFPVIEGIILGLLLWTRYNNVSVFLTYTGWVVICELFKKEKHWMKTIIHLFISFAVAGLVGFIVWPFLLIDFSKGIIATVSEHKTRRIISSLYHVRYLLFTTPDIILFTTITGVVACLKQRKETMYYLLWWFFSTLLFFVIWSSPTGGTRYMFVVYPSMALISAIGLKWMFDKVKKRISIWIVIAILLYGLLTLFSIHPYYLDYYNLFVGGAKGAQQKELELGWWGEGQREAGLWLKKNAKQNAKIGLMVTPKYVFPQVRSDSVVFPYGEKIEEADYVVVSRSDISSFKKIVGKWKQIFAVKTQNIPLVYVFERIR